MKQVVALEEAIGYPLAHDITEIRPGEFKGAAFHKGHVLKADDLPLLRNLGKNHLYIIQTEDNEMHEDDAAEMLATSLVGQGVGWEGAPREGKITIKAERDGLLKVDSEALARFNMFGEVMCATRHTNTLVKKGDIVAATRAIPLVVEREIVAQAVQAALASETKILNVLPIRHPKVSVLITGDEVFHGRIEDKFEKVIRKKVVDLGGQILDVQFAPDDDEVICRKALELVSGGAELLITTGGMSVDADDRTRFAMAQAGISDIVYGSPVLPGAMFMVAYMGDIPVLGIPACGMYASRTILDLIYPRILAGEKNYPQRNCSTWSWWPLPELYNLHLSPLSLW